MLNDFTKFIREWYKQDTNKRNIHSYKKWKNIAGSLIEVINFLTNNF